MNTLKLKKKFFIKTGINLEILAIPTSTLAEKSKILLASKDNMPDIFRSHFTDDQRRELGMQGAFVDRIEAEVDMDLNITVTRK